MCTGRRWLGVLLVCACWPGTAAELAAAEYIHDEASLFSAAARERAEENIERLVERFHVEIVVESFAEMPAKWQEQRKTAADDKVMAQWAQERAAKRDGVYILICREPMLVQIVVGAAAVERGFSHNDGERLV